MERLLWRSAIQGNNLFVIGRGTTAEEIYTVVERLRRILA